MIRLANTEEVRPLRHSILRPGKPYSSTLFSGDLDPHVYHFSYKKLGQDLGVVTYHPKNLLNEFSENIFQLRGMAVAENHQGKGIGQLMLEFSIGFLMSNFHLKYVWCNSRNNALKFYKKNGFSIEGKEFQIPEVGPHHLMTWKM